MATRMKNAMMPSPRRIGPERGRVNGMRNEVLRRGGRRARRETLPVAGLNAGQGSRVLPWPLSPFIPDARVEKGVHDIG